MSVKCSSYACKAVLERFDEYSKDALKAVDAVKKGYWKQALILLSTMDYVRGIMDGYLGSLAETEPRTHKQLTKILHSSELDDIIKLHYAMRKIVENKFE